MGGAWRPRRSRLPGAADAVHLDTSRSTRILSIEALFLEPAGDVCAESGAIWKLGFRTEGCVEQEADGSWVESWVWARDGVSNPRLAPAGPSF